MVERAQARGLTWQLSPDLLGALNSKGYFETSNPAWQTVLGWSEAEVASMSIFELLHPDDMEHTRAGFELTLVGQPALRFVNRYRCKNGGYRWIAWIGIQEDGFVYCTGRDITGEKMAEIELAAAQEALRQSQKMETVGHLTGGIAHDFNNLLTGIIGSLDLVRRRMASGRRPEDIRRFMDAATTLAHRAAALTHRLLGLRTHVNRSIPGRTTSIGLIAGMEDLLHRTLGEQVEVAFQPGCGTLDGFRRRQPAGECHFKTCINARDAMMDGGKLTIATANTPGWSRTYTSQHEDLRRATMSLSAFQTGVGTPPDVLAKAVDPFFTTKPAGIGNRPWIVDDLRLCQAEQGPFTHGESRGAWHDCRSCICRARCKMPLT